MGSRVEGRERLGRCPRNERREDDFGWAGERDYVDGSGRLRLDAHAHPVVEVEAGAVSAQSRVPREQVG